MVSISSCRSDLVPGVFCTKIGAVHPRVHSHNLSFNRSTFRNRDFIQLGPRKVSGRSINRLPQGGCAVKCASFAERNYQSSVNDGDDPFLANSMKQTIRAVKSILQFLAEQPSQLKYIEWPGFQSTLKTAILALVLVGLFIVVLSSIDSALSYMLALYLRRTA